MDEEEIKYFVRVRNTDLDGTKAVHIALTGIKGVGSHTSRTIAALAGVDPRAIIGKLDDESVGRIASAVDTYTEQVPAWMVNRPKDIYTGDARHLLGTDLTMANDDDVNRMRKMRTPPSAILGSWTEEHCDPLSRSCAADKRRGA